MGQDTDSRELILGRFSWWIEKSLRSDFRSANNRSGNERGLRALRDARSAQS